MQAGESEEPTTTGFSPSSNSENVFKEPSKSKVSTPLSQLIPQRRHVGGRAAGEGFWAGDREIL